MQDGRGNERNERNEGKEVKEGKQTQEVPQPPEPVVSIMQVRLYTIPKIGVGGCMPVFKITNGEEEYKSNDFCKPKAMVKVRSKGLCMIIIIVQPPPPNVCCTMVHGL